MIKGIMSSEFEHSLTWLPALQAVAKLILADLQPRRIDWLSSLEAETCSDHRCIAPPSEGSW